MAITTDTADARPVSAVESLRKVVSGMAAGRVRPGQEHMCDAVADSMNGGGHLVADAGTGTGKSLAYLVPAALTEQTVVIATATKALQDQIVKHDIPRVREGLGCGLTAVTLKGRSNYLCVQKLAEATEDSEAGLFPTRAPGADIQMRNIVEWADTTETGDQADLSFQPSDEVWRAVSVDARECPGRKQCPSGEQCFAERAADAAAEADIVIVNQHLYALHASSYATRGVPLLPDHNVVVIDEAHELEDVASSVFGASLTLRRFKSLVDRLEDFIPQGRAASLDQSADRLFTLLSAYRDEAVPLPMPADLGEALRQTQIALNLAIRDLHSADEQRVAGGSPTPTKKSGDPRQQKLRLVKIANGLRDDLNTVNNSDGSSVPYAMWVESNRSAVTWRIAPVDVAQLLRNRIWQHTTAVLCSATIPPNFDQAWGLSHEPHTHIDVGSPFDYKHQAMLYVPEGMPQPKSREYDAAVHDHMEDLIRMADGRTLALFTSYRAMDAAAVEMRRRLPNRILTQRDLPKPALIEEFASGPECCLLGTLGLWQGVDVPGDSLSLVVIARLPFPRPDDPLLQARRSAHGSKAFMQVDVPRATTRLAQGAGRLIRTETDRGVVAVLDSRLAESKYGQKMIASLPPYTRTRTRAKVEQFIAQQGI